MTDYAGLTWSDIAAERGDGIVAAIREFLSRYSAPPSVRLPQQEGEIAGISYRVRGAGAPLGFCQHLRQLADTSRRGVRCCSF